jgi:hypothetical protein
MLVGGIFAAWFGAAFLGRIPKTRIMGVIAVLLLAGETMISGTAWSLVAQGSVWHWPAALIAGLLVRFAATESDGRSCILLRVQGLPRSPTNLASRSTSSC